jgi:glycosyltransferase involved in cell wall biosynthesis
MRIAYVTEYDAADIHQWSGLGYHIASCLESQGFTLDYIGSLRTPLAPRMLWKAKRFQYWLQGRNYLQRRNLALGREYARQIERHPALATADLVFSPGSIPISALDTSLPIVIWTDATFAGMVGFYPAYSNLCTESIAAGNQLEQAALARCRLALYSSEWAARTAREHYPVDPGKLRVVPFGANLTRSYSRDEVAAFIRQRDRSTCKLLFLGVDWQRKGGDIALQVAAQLHARGLPVELHVAGCVPPGLNPDFVHRYGFLTKSTPAGREAIDRLMRESHFLILPTRSDATPLVLNEASAYGLPSLATNIGGVSSLIREGRNGFLFDPPAAIDRYVNAILTTWSRRDQYEAL